MLTACRFPQVNADLGFMPPPKRTNADRIRGMSDEELAQFLCNNITCDMCKADEFCHPGHTGWLDWLKDEAEGGE